MTRNTSVSLGTLFAGFISTQIAAGRYGNASEVIRAGLRLLEEHEQKVEALRQSIELGVASGDAGSVNFDEIRSEARRRAGLVPSDGKGAGPGSGGQG